MNTKLKTKYGTATLCSDGYYYITSTKEGYNSKLLHRLIFEEFYGVIPKGYVIHHIDGNKTNNCIMNLKMMKHGEHTAFHGYGNTRALGVKHTPETIKKMSDAHKNKKFSTEHKRNLSNSTNATGIYRVHKHADKRCTQGFTWVYRYYNEKGKPANCCGVHLEQLKENVLSKGLDWFILDEEKARDICIQHGYSFEGLVG